MLVFRQIILVWGIMLFPVMQAVSQNIDSLTNVYDSLGHYYSRQADNEKAIEYFNKSLQLNIKNKDTAGIIRSLEAISYSYQRLKHFREAIPYQMRACKLYYLNNDGEPDVYYKKVAGLMNKEPDSLTLTRLYYRFALLLDKMEQKSRSVDYFVQALKLAHALQYDKAISTIANDLAGEYWDLGAKKLSMHRYLEALDASIRLNDSNRMSGIYLNIGDNYKEMGDLENGMKYMIKALRIKESISDSARICFYYVKAAELAQMTLNNEKWKTYIDRAYHLKDKKSCATPMDKALIYQNLGEIALMEGNKENALKYFDTLALISRAINYQNGLRIALVSKATLYQKEGDYGQALKLYNEAEKYITENPFYAINSNNNRARLYMALNKYQNALSLLEENINNPMLDNYAELKLTTLQLLYKVYTELARYKEAFVWNDSLRNFENRLRDRDVRARIAELETKYETEKNKHTISILKAKNEFYNQQIRFAVLLIIILIAVIIIVVYVWRMNKLKSEFREARLKQSLLRSQMNPHFIFNSLSSIQQLILTNKNKEASFYLTRFSSIARIVLEYSTRESITLDKEIEFLTDYIEIEKMRSGKGFEFQVIYSDNLETEFIEIPPMAIQPFVENAIKHGLRSKESGGLLKLIFKDKGDVLEVMVEDNGIGIHHAQQNERKEHKSMAMNIFEMRRQLLQKQFKKKLDIKFYDLSEEGKTGTRVIILLPIL